MPSDPVRSRRRFSFGKMTQNLLYVAAICGLSNWLAVRLALHHDLIDKENALMVFLIGVLVVTVLTKGNAYGFLAALISVLCFNYNFSGQGQSRIFYNFHDFTLILFFLLAALLCSWLVRKYQKEARSARENERIAKLLCQVSNSLFNAVGVDGIAGEGLRCIHENVGYPCCVMLHSLEHRGTQERFETKNFPQRRRRDRDYVLPIEGRMGQMGTLILANAHLPLRREKELLLQAVVPQMALALDREAGYIERERHLLAAENERLKSMLLRGISHDLRTPLTEIMGAGSLLADSTQALEESSVRLLGRNIHDAASWLMMTVQNVLNLTRINDTFFDLKKQPESVDDLINQAALHRPRSMREGSLQVSLPEDILLVEVNGPLLVQALVNLLDNAWRHGGEDCLVELEAYAIPGWVVFRVSDNGKGIDPSIQDTLFEEFITLQSARSEGGVGIGLGLSLCKAIVQAHGGTILASNRPGGGASFTIKIPYEEETL